MKNILTAAPKSVTEHRKAIHKNIQKGGYTLMRIHPIYIEYMT